MLKLALIAVERFKHCLAAVQTASIGVNRPIPEARYQHGPSQDTSARNFIPQCDFTRYCKRTRDCSCNGTTVCQKPRCRFRTTRWSVVSLSARVAAEGRVVP